MTKDQPEFDVDLILNEKAIHTLFGEVNSDSAESAVRFILAHNCVPKKTQSITLIVNSSGGDLHHAFALVDCMVRSKVPVHTLGLGEISSAGLLIFMAGASGHRLITRNTMIMSHQWSGTFEGKMHELVSAQQDLAQTTHRMMQHYLKCSHLSEQEINSHLLCASDVYLTADQAVQMGIADRIA
jgi:ATP-dependent Clp protease protease subunit